jgi:fatty acid desaturase
LPALKVYDVTKWIENHPGGQLPLLSLAGRDATDAFSSFHAGWVAQTRLAAFEVGIATPPLAKQRAAAAAAPSADEDFRALKKQLEREGLFAPTYRFYALEALRIASLFALVLACTASAHAPLRLAGAVALGIFWQQAAFVGHDAGHGGISGRRCVDSAVGLLCGNALTGIEIGWWQSTHNVHHLVPNSVEHDADVQHLPFMAVSEAFLGGIFSAYHNDVMPCPCGVLRLLSWQHLYFFPILTVARYGLLLQGVKTVGWEWGKRHTGFGAPHAPWTRALEAAALAVFYAYAAWLLTRLPNAAERLLFTYLSGATFAILHLQARCACACVVCVCHCSGRTHACTLLLLPNRPADKPVALVAARAAGAAAWRLGGHAARGDAQLVLPALAGLVRCSGAGPTRRRVGLVRADAPRPMCILVPPGSTAACSSRLSTTSSRASRAQTSARRAARLSSRAAHISFRALYLTPALSPPRSRL